MSIPCWQLLALVGAGVLRAAGRALPAGWSARPLQPSFGRWIELARETLAASDLDDPLLEAARETLLGRPAGGRSLLQALEEMVALRNRLMHQGEGPAQPEALAADLLQRLEAAPLFSAARLVVIDRAELLEAGQARYQPLELHGLVFPGRPFRGGAPALEPGQIYLRQQDAPRFVPLHPLMAWHERRALLLAGVDRRDRPQYIDPGGGLHRLGELSERVAEVRGTTPRQNCAEPTTQALGPAPMSAGQTEPLLGRVVGGAYRLVERLGAGGFGTVYAGWDLTLRREVALKLLHGHTLGSEEARRRFAAECRVLAGLAHPRIVRLYDVGRSADSNYLAMERLPGPTLREWIAQRSPDEEARGAAVAALDASDYRRIARWVRDASRAVHEAHGQGVVHRDLNPSNLMLDAAGEVKLLDFGLAHVSDEEITRTRAEMGTPRYMAPEQALDAKRVGPAADIYGLGLTLYALLSLGRPFHEVEGDHAIRQAVHLGSLAPLAQRNRRAPEELATICAKATRLHPAERYASAAALGDDLDRWLEGRPILARPAGVLERTLKWVRRHPARAAALAALAAAAVLMGGLALLWQAEARKARQAERRARRLKVLADGQWSEAVKSRRRAESAEAAAVRQRKKFQAEAELLKAQREENSGEMMTALAHAIASLRADRSPSAGDLAWRLRRA